MEIDPERGWWVDHCHGCEGGVNSRSAEARKVANMGRVERVWGVPDAGMYCTMSTNMTGGY